MVIIKKYQNRRMYNTKTKSYIRLDQIIEMVDKSSKFQVIDIKSGLDITHATLIQVILEQNLLDLSSLSNEALKSFIMILIGKNKNAYYQAFKESIEHFSSQDIKPAAIEEIDKSKKSYLDSSKLTQFWQSIAYSSNNED